jgi:hypothetical protein
LSTNAVEIRGVHPYLRLGSDGLSFVKELFMRTIEVAATALVALAAQILFVGTVLI